MLLTWRIWWAPNNASSWQMGFNSTSKGLKEVEPNTTRHTVVKKLTTYEVPLEKSLKMIQSKLSGAEGMKFIRRHYGNTERCYHWQTLREKKILIKYGWWNGRWGNSTLLQYCKRMTSYKFQRITMFVYTTDRSNQKWKQNTSPEF